MSGNTPAPLASALTSLCERLGKSVSGPSFVPGSWAIDFDRGQWTVVEVQENGGALHPLGMLGRSIGEAVDALSVTTGLEHSRV